MACELMGCAGCCDRNGRCCLKNHRKPFEYPNWVYITPNPCRIIETATILGLITMFITVIVYASFTLDNLDDIQKNMAEVWYANEGKLEALQDQVNSNPQDKRSIYYLKSTYNFFLDLIDWIFMC